MRPLAVLVLVLGAVAALFFAVTSLSKTSRQTTVSQVEAAAPADDTRRAAAALDTVERLPEEQTTQEPRRAEVEITTATAGEVTGAFQNWIEGTVRDPKGNPIQGAAIELRKQAPGSQFAGLIRAMNPDAPAGTRHRSAVTDMTGRYRFATLDPSQSWLVAVQHPDYSPAEVGPLTLSEDGGTIADVQLREGFALFGYVRDHETGLAIAGAEVSLSNPAAIYRPQPAGTASTDPLATTDEAGYYRFENIPGGQRSMVVRRAGYGTQIKFNVNFVGRDESQMSQDFQLKLGQLIAGRVFGPDRSGIEGVTVRAISNGHDPGSVGDAASSSDGEFLISDLEEGLYTLQVTAPGWDVEPKLRVEAGTSDVEIQLFEQGKVLGKVVDAATGRPLPDFTCRVRQVHKTNKAWGHEVAHAEFRDAKDGSFELGGIPQGTYVVQGDVRGYASSFSDEFTITQGLTTPDVVVRMTRGGTIRGRLVDSASGQPIARAEIATNDNNHIESEFVTFLQQLWPSALTRTQTTSDAEGRFEVALMTPETYQISISSPNHTRVVLNDVRIGDGLKTDLGIIEMTAGASVSGVVYGPDGRPAPGYTVSLSRLDNAIWGNLRGRTDANGRFTIANASPGEYKLAAARPRDSATNPFETIIDQKNSEVRIVLADGQNVAQDLYLAPQ